MMALQITVGWWHQALQTESVSPWLLPVSPSLLAFMISPDVRRGMSSLLLRWGWKFGNFVGEAVCIAEEQDTFHFCDSEVGSSFPMSRCLSLMNAAVGRVGVSGGAEQRQLERP